MKETLLWVVGKYVAETDFGTGWELQGIFSTEADAVDICKGRRDFFVGPVELDHEFPYAPTEWAGCYYPSDKKEKTK
jgi:hypothetical protein